MSTGQPLVSVILCNYNYGRFIAEAIDSVLCQTYANFELIIVDDGSTDDSREVIASYNDPRMQIIFRQNRGQAAALNTGFAKASGEFVAFLDSDDIWKPEKLAKTVQAFEQGDFSVVQHNFEVIDHDSQSIGKLHPGVSPGIRNVLKAYFAENHTGFFSSTSGIVCRRIGLGNIFPLDESWQICADVALTRPLPIFGQVFTLKELLGYYRIHGSNCWMNTDRQSQRIESEQKYIEYTNQWLAKWGYTERIEFTKSAIYQNWRLQHLPWYHPRRLWKRAKAASVLPESLKTLFRPVKQWL